ncbi:uncharacterized protein A4U43_C09F2960 [Asparagus officinalis]|uniref:Uncharacterized protein n=1 Tax=Asparagus officinalis TaxID=4686 RepID=A0A5P1E5D5_ASPOF|nr:uncharacterized protein A4U43_C09F2960 [Asparagus officinalis]
MKRTEAVATDAYAGLGGIGNYQFKVKILVDVEVRLNSGAETMYLFHGETVKCPMFNETMYLDFVDAKRPESLLRAQPSSFDMIEALESQVCFKSQHHTFSPLMIWGTRSTAISAPYQRRDQHQIDGEISSTTTRSAARRRDRGRMRTSPREDDDESDDGEISITTFEKTAAQRADLVGGGCTDLGKCERLRGALISSEEG